MARQSSAQSARPQLTEEELAEGFARLVSNQWRPGEAGPFLKRLKAVPSVSAPYLVRHLVAGGPRERETAASLIRLLAGPRVIVPLREALKDTGLTDEARLSVSVALQGLGESVSAAGSARSMRDPARLFESIWETVMERSEDNESFLEGLLAGMEDAPTEERDEVVRSLAEPGDARAVRVLRPLLFSKRSSTVLAAIDAIERVRGVEALDLLKELAEHDTSASVRKQARIAYGRLFMLSGAQLPGFESPKPPASRKLRSGPVLATADPLPVHRAWTTLIDGRGHQGVVVARRRPDRLLKVLTVIVSDTEGIRRVIGMEAVQDDELTHIEAQLSQEGLAPVEAGLEACRRAVDEARRLHLTLQRQRLPWELEVWRSLLGRQQRMPLEAAPEDLARRRPSPDLLALIPETGRLMALPEFHRWTFEQALVWPYVDEWTRSANRLNGQAALGDEERLNAIVGTAARDLFGTNARRVWGRRLQRQSALLEQLGRGEPSRLAAAAALGLDPVNGVPSDLHPFARAMVLASLYDAGLRIRQGW